MAAAIAPPRTWRVEISRAVRTRNAKMNSSAFTTTAATEVRARDPAPRSAP